MVASCSSSVIALWCCVVAAVVVAGGFATPLRAQAGAHDGQTISRGPKVHPLSQFRPAIGARANTSGVGTKLVVEPATISGSGVFVTVTWTNYQFATKQDWIGLFCPATSSPYSQTPVKFRWLDDLNSTGSFRFYVQNIREDCRFYLLSGGAQFALIEAVSNVMTNTNPNYPNGVRLSLPTTAKTPSMRVTWTTANAASPVVRYGTKPGEYTMSMTAQSTTYNQNSMCGEPAKSRGWISPGLIHTAILQNLQPDVQYYYIVGDDSSVSSSDWSESANFFAPNPSSTATNTFLAFGDMGNAPIDGAGQHSWDYGNRGELNSLNTTHGLLQAVQGTAVRPNAVVHFGDISYAVGYEAEWDQFQEQIRPVASQLPWMMSIGNHEIGDPTSYVPGTDSGGECGVPFVRRFIMPPPADNPLPTSPWYSFQSGLVHWIMMSTEHSFQRGTPQYTWLTATLNSVNRTQTPWLIFTGHRPMYVDSTYSGTPYSDQGYATLMRETLEPLLVAAKVDLALWGHHHSYQRTCPIISSNCVTDGPVHVVVGTAGYELTKNFFPVRPSYFVTAINDYWGFATITATPSTLHLDFVTVDNGTVRDSFTLVH